MYQYRHTVANTSYIYTYVSIQAYRPVAGVLRLCHVLLELLGDSLCIHTYIYIYIYVYMYIYIYACVYVYKYNSHIPAHTALGILTLRCICTFVYVNAEIQTLMYIQVQIYECTNKPWTIFCIYIYIYIYIYIHTYIHLRLYLCTQIHTRKYTHTHNISARCIQHPKARLQQRMCII
jgi:hypothetical protein